MTKSRHITEHGAGASERPVRVSPEVARNVGLYARSVDIAAYGIDAFVERTYQAEVMRLQALQLAGQQAVGQTTVESTVLASVAANMFAPAAIQQTTGAN